MKRQKLTESPDGDRPHTMQQVEETEGETTKNCGCDAPRNYHGSEVNVFREHEKLYRAPPQAKPNAFRQQIRAAQKAAAEQDFSKVIDFTKLETLSPEIRNLIEEIEPAGHVSPYFGKLKKGYSVKSVPGLIFIPNPFTHAQEKYWIHRCMKNYTLNNPTNISNLQGNKELWTEWKKEYMSELRWSSLGYHFQWTERIYTEDHHGEFPADLGQLCAEFAREFGYPDMTAEAAIINFYPHTRCTMGAHLDDAEDDMSQPIVSCTFGNTVIFLIGGRTRDVPPVALYIRSGDVVLMGGEARYAYHAIPRMMDGTCPSYLSEYNPETDPADWSDCADYIKNARINMNCRQVRIPGKELKRASDANM